MRDFTTALRLSHLLFGPANVYSASVLHDMGMLFCRVDRKGTALRCLEDSLEMRRTVLGSDHPVTADTLYSLGTLHARFGQYDDCVVAYGTCLDVRAKLEGNEAKAGVAKLLVNLGIVHARHGLYRKAIDSLEGALKVRDERVRYMETVLKVKSSARGRGFSNPSRMGMGDDGSLTSVDTQGDAEKAQEIEKAKRDLRAEEKELAVVFHNLGNVFLKRGEMEQAVRNYECALKIRRRQCGCEKGGFAEIALSGGVASDASSSSSTTLAGSSPTQPAGEEELEGMADTLHSMGCAFEATRRFNLALGCYNEALVIKRSLAVADAPSMVSPGRGGTGALAVPEAATVASTRAIVLADQGNGMTVNGGQTASFDEGVFTLSYANTLIRIGSVHSKLANYDISLSHYESALRVQRRRLGRDHVAVARTLSDMGRILRRRGAAAEAGQDLGVESGSPEASELIAMKCYGEALRISRLRFGPNHVSVAGVMYDMGGVYDSRGDYDRAMECFRHSLRVYGRRYASDLFRQLMGNPLPGSPSSGGNSVDEFAGGSGDPFSTDVTNGPNSNLRPASVAKFDRDQYMRVSKSLQDSVRKSYGDRLGDSLILGVLDAESCSSLDSCWMSLEMLLFRLMELLGIYLVAPARAAIDNNLNAAVRRIDSVGQHAIVTAQDTIAYQFLYLVHE